ncbi:SDR family oxidoreductase [Kribbella sp. ALI-6-A]|uniref:SDR family oxidoreductase n=1 Tax=Kribbella sp. ALI-6-A TaxID=1933817 RepID=UPI001EDAEF23
MQKKVVVITGASSGIGAATARRLARAGHEVWLGARRADRIAELGAEIGAGHHVLDVTSLDSMREFVSAARAAYGRVDVLVNNAGVMPLSPLADLKVDEWNQMIDVNLRGVLHGLAVVLPVMREQGGGHVVNLSSVSGLRVDPTAARVQRDEVRRPGAVGGVAAGEPGHPRHGGESGADGERAG